MVMVMLIHIHQAVNLSAVLLERLAAARHQCTPAVYQVWLFLIVMEFLVTYNYLLYNKKKCMMFSEVLLINPLQNGSLFLMFVSSRKITL